MPAKESIRSMLTTGRHRLSVGRAAEVAELVLASPRLAPRLVECLWDEDPGVANRGADALERLTFYQPRLLDKWKDPLLGLLAEATEKKVRWNLALIIPRARLSLAECRRAASILQSWLEDPSSIVKTLALQGLADLATRDPSLLPEVLDQLRILGRSGTPAMRARSRHLLRELDPPNGKAPRRRVFPTGRASAASLSPSAGR
jgi:hypothetical protein